MHDIKTGGMGVVYICYDNEMKAPVALKTFQDKYLANSSFARRFKHEAEIWVRLKKHHNIVRALWLEEIKDRLYIVLEYVGGNEECGADLTGWIYKRHLTLPQCLKFSIQFCHGMTYARRTLAEIGIDFVHQDIKPSNIMVTRDELIKVTDFGLVKAFTALGEDILLTTAENKPPGRLTFGKSGEICGTPPYMSPEQCRGEKIIDLRSDIYSFGCVLFEMLTRKHIFDAFTPVQFVYHHLNTAPKFHKKLDNVVLKCLNKNPARRYRDFTELERDLSQLYYDITGKTVQQPDDVALGAQDLENRAVSLSILGYHQEAENCYQQSLKMNPKSPSAWYNKGVSLDNLGQYEEAMKCFDRVLEIDSTFFRAWEEKGRLLCGLGEYPESLHCCNRALEIDPNYASSWHYKGVSLAHLEKFQEAMDCFDKALEIDRGFELSWNGKAFVFSRLGELQRAMECYDRALAINDKLKTTWHRKGDCLQELGRYQESIECYDKTLELAPQDLDAWNCKGNALGNLGRDKEAIVCYDRALEIDPNADYLWCSKSASLGALGRFAAAVDCCNRALEINPRYAEVWSNKGLFLKALGRNREAVNCFQRFLQFAPSGYASDIKKIEGLIRKLGEST